MFMVLYIHFSKSKKLIYYFVQLIHIFFLCVLDHIQWCWGLISGCALRSQCWLVWGIWSGVRNLTQVHCIQVRCAILYSIYLPYIDNHCIIILALYMYSLYSLWNEKPCNCISVQRLWSSKHIEVNIIWFRRKRVFIPLLTEKLLFCL